MFGAGVASILSIEVLHTQESPTLKQEWLGGVVWPCPVSECHNPELLCPLVTVSEFPVSSELRTMRVDQKSGPRGGSSAPASTCQTAVVCHAIIRGHRNALKNQRQVNGELTSMYIQPEILPLSRQMTKLHALYTRYLLIFMHERKGWNPRTPMLLFASPPFDSELCIKEMKCHVWWGRSPSAPTLQWGLASQEASAAFHS
ncbi:uncharacterized protein LOC120601453 [Pteropus medius]|uniref:uncharacterized protein LOC120601453 n=1 Tax=Pteropus vampyrus TaxID=132908 RepID=UPI00196A863F|nr:uncharacterized protein LOC120601453 [Pteropus giganteus]